MVILFIIFSLISAGTTYALLDPIGNYLKGSNSNLQVTTSETPTNEIETSLEQFKKDIKAVNSKSEKEIGDYESNSLVDVLNNITLYQRNRLSQVQLFSEEAKHQQLDRIIVYTEQKKQFESEQIVKDLTDILTDLTKE
ncbi:hypothetical protein [Heyndrickxia oleronia]|uniref:hypothetical protein n=1 Tax=Heyndrickxia oleronia TaxID=38875 RepID=UPI001B101C9E|nr:hypothetical protein [Heyndrickxia oleronia]GIN41997.1 hypothetical protein J19TS1_49460 [Heyndrickxia oleronia]